MTPNVRWMVKSDWPQVISIYNAAFHPNEWTEDEVALLTRQRNLVSYVATNPRTDRVLGFMIYEWYKSRLHLLTIATSDKDRGIGVGRTLLNKAKYKCEQHGRPRVTLYVPEQLLDAQLFFRACGFKAVTVMHDLSDEDEAVSYAFEWKVPQTVGVKT